MKKIIVAFFMFAFITINIFCSKLVLKNGKILSYVNEYQIDGKNIILVLENKMKVSIPLDLVDFEKTKFLNSEEMRKNQAEENSTVKSTYSGSSQTSVSSRDLKRNISEKSINGGHGSIFNAIINKDMAKLKQLLKKESNSDYDPMQDITLLNLAIANGNIDAVKYFVRNGDFSGRLNMKYSKTPPLHVAVRYGKTDIFKYLIQYVDLIDQINGSYYTPLHEAIIWDNLEIVKSLISQNASPAFPDKWGRNSIHLAACNENPAILEYLLTQEINIDAQDNSGCTPLHFASLKGLAKNIQLLLDHGANIQITDNLNNSLMHKVAMSGNVDAAILLQKKGLSPNIISKEGFTPLHLSAKFGRIECLKFFLANGADINGRYVKKQMTPLHLAVQYDNFLTIKYLVEHGANINLQDNEKKTPLDYANEEIGAYLISKNAK